MRRHGEPGDQLTRSNSTRRSLDVDADESNTDVVARIDAAGADPREHRRLGDLDLDAPLALVDHDGVEDLALATLAARPPRRGRAPRARPGSLAARPGAIACGQIVERGGDRVGHRPAVRDRERGLDHVAVLQAAQRCRRLGVRRGDRRVPRASLRVERRVAGAAGCSSHREQERRRARIVAGQRSLERIEGRRRPANRVRTPGPSVGADDAGARRRRASPGTARCRRRTAPSPTARLVASDSAAFCSSDVEPRAEPQRVARRRRADRSPARGTRLGVHLGRSRRPRSGGAARRIRRADRPVPPCRTRAWRGCGRSPARPRRATCRRRSRHGP